MKIKLWLHGLFAAFIFGAATVVSLVVLDPKNFDLETGWKKLLTVCLCSGIVSVAAYLMKSPLPAITDESEPKKSDASKTVLSICLMGSILFLSTGCVHQVDSASTQPAVVQTPEAIVAKYSIYATMSAQVGCSITLSFAVSDKDRVDKANIVYSIAHAIRTLSGGEVTPEALRGVIVLWAPDKAHWADLADSIKDSYAIVYTRYLKGNVYLTAKFLEALALGCEAAANTYRVIPQ